MNAVLVLSIGIVILIVGYIFYGGWLAKQWGVDDSTVTPAHELEDGMDDVPHRSRFNDQYSHSLQIRTEVLLQVRLSKSLL